MSRFDPVRRRHALETGGLDFIARMERADYLPNAVGSAAVDAIATLVYAILVGLDSGANALIGKFEAWLEDSIARGEQFGDPPELFAALRQETHGLVIWLRSGVSASVEYSRAADLLEQAWRSVPATSIRTRHLPDFMRACVQAGEMARAQAAYEAFGGPPAAEEKHPELELALEACTADSAMFVTRGIAVLSVYLQDSWLGSGHALRAAFWLKTVFGDTDIAPTPRDALLWAYDLMPDVPRPPFLEPAPNSYRSSAYSHPGGPEPSMLWALVRACLARRLSVSDAVLALVAAGLTDPDWRARMTAVLAVGRLRLAKLAVAANRIEVPGTDVGLKDDERRALLALRDIAPLLAAGQSADSARPVHPDPEVARKRAEFAARVTAAIEGTSWPPPSHPAYVLRALAEPDKVRSTAPPHWRGWLTPD